MLFSSLFKDLEIATVFVDLESLPLLEETVIW